MDRLDCNRNFDCFVGAGIAAEFAAGYMLEVLQKEEKRGGIKVAIVSDRQVSGYYYNQDDPLTFKSHLAYVPDNPDVYEFMTGIAYLDFISNIFKVGEEKNELIHKYASMFGIENDLANPIKAYSHGMKQKIQIIAAILHKPKLMVLDEPFVGLDPKAAFDLKEVMKELCKEGTMILFSSHVLEVVEKFCNKIAIIKKGKIIASGLTEDVRAGESLEEKFMELFDEK